MSVCCPITNMFLDVQALYVMMNIKQKGNREETNAQKIRKNDKMVAEVSFL